MHAPAMRMVLITPTVVTEWQMNNKYSRCVQNLAFKVHQGPDTAKPVPLGPGMASCVSVPAMSGAHGSAGDR